SLRPGRGDVGLLHADAAASRRDDHSQPRVDARPLGGASRRATRAAVLSGAAWRQRDADRRHAEVELSADLAPQGGVHAAAATDLGGRAPARAVTEDAVVGLSTRPGA